MNSILYTPVVSVSQSANQIASWPCALAVHSDSAQIAAPSSSADFVQLEDFSFSLAQAVDVNGNRVDVLFTADVSLTVDDWGQALVDDSVVVDMSAASHAQDAGAEGGHLKWSQQANVLLSSGNHTLSTNNQNIDYSDPSSNIAYCGYSISARPLRPGGRSVDSPCPCSSECDAGGLESSSARSLSSSPSFSSSSAGSMSGSLIDTYAYWSGSFGVFRGLSGVPAARLELMAEDSVADLADLANLTYNCPLLAKLMVPTGGIVPGTRFELHQGSRIIAFYCENDGSIAPIGVDTWGGGRCLLTGNEFIWRTEDRLQYTFDATSGALLKFKTASNKEFDDASDFVRVVRDGEGRISQIWNYWDGLLQVEDVTSSGYKLKIYPASQISAFDESSGHYVVSGSAIKTWVCALNDAETEFSVTEQTTSREDYTIAWWKNDTAWCIKRGSGDDEMTTLRSRTELEPSIYQIITEHSKGGVVSSRMAEVYQHTMMGELLLTRVEGYGSEGALMSQYGYDGKGNQNKMIASDGSVTYWYHDIYGRLTLIDEPWAAQGRKKTWITYKDTDVAVFSAEEKSREVRVYPASGKAISFLKEEYAYSIADGIKRVTTTATAEGVTQTSITETYLASVDNIHARGRSRMSQAVNGVQTWYEYAACAEFGALYTVTTETKVAGELVNGKSTRQVEWINAQGCTVREESFVLLMDGTWASVSSAVYEFDNRNRWIKRTRGNGRVTQRELMCDGSVLWEIDEDGVRTDNAYDHARQLVESIRSAVTDGEVTITPETITSYTRDAEGRVLQTRTDTGAMTTIESTAYDLQKGVWCLKWMYWGV